MHMADALISPEVGGALWLASSVATGYAVKKFNPDNSIQIPKMAVMGAFVFSAQMINFAIPGTGSSGHIGGGLLLASLLGPWGAFITLASVLGVQALFFADGGLLAYGCNLFNMGFFSCLLAYPLIFKALIGNNPSKAKLWTVSILTAVVGLQLGAFSVVLETLFSGRTELPFSTFVLLMQPIHLAIGIVEGAITAAILSFIASARPDFLDFTHTKEAPTSKKVSTPLVALLAAALLVGGIGSWYASSDPDGLEWSITHVVGSSELERTSEIHQVVESLQEKLAFLPDYSFKNGTETQARLGTTVSGITGSVATMALVSIAAVTFRKTRKNKLSQNPAE